LNQHFRASYERILAILLAERASLDKTIAALQGQLDNWPVA